MKCVHTLSRWLKHACALGGACVAAALFMAMVVTEYQVARVIWYYKLDRAWLTEWIPLTGRPLMWAALLSWGALWMGGLWACRRIFKACAEGQPFSQAVVSGFQMLAGVMLVSFPVACLLTPATNWAFWLAKNIIYLFIGLTLWVFAWLMKEALRLRHEQDLVV